MNLQQLQQRLVQFTEETRPESRLKNLRRTKKMGQKKKNDNNQI
jgi:hypothetical protein